MPGSLSQRLASIAGFGPYGRLDGGRYRHPASALLQEADAIDEATGSTPLLSTSLVLAAWRGQEERALQLIEASIEDATPGNEGRATALAEYAQALLYNGLGRYQTALSAAERACRHKDVGPFDWALAELVEAGARGDSFEVAARALRRLEERPAAAGVTGSALGVRVRSRALLSERENADVLYRDALGWLAGSRTALQLARTRLVYGEWLRREGRRVDARDQLRAARGTFNRLGAGGFAERARRELLATGETARKRTVETRDDLTAQEGLIAALAGHGRTNPEIGAELFISPRTVEWHLRKVFRKMGINSRKQLRGAAADEQRGARGFRR